MIGTRKTDGLSYDVTVAQSKTLVANRGHARLVGERWPGPDPTKVLLHAGVTDRRSWQAVVGGLNPNLRRILTPISPMKWVNS